MRDQIDFDIHQVIKYLPHRYPFLLVDRVIALEKGKSLHAIKNVTINEDFFNGHFPGLPVMPGVLILESIAQAAGIFAYLSTDDEPQKDEVYFLAGIDNARFKQVVYPGDQLNLIVEFDVNKRGMWKVKGRAEVDGKIVCSADFLSVKKEVNKSD